MRQRWKCIPEAPSPLTACGSRITTAWARRLANFMFGRGNISLTKAYIKNNASAGIQVYSNGAVLFTNVRVQENGSGGAQIYNTEALNCHAGHTDRLRL